MSWWGGSGVKPHQPLGCWLPRCNHDAGHNDEIVGGFQRVDGSGGTALALLVYGGKIIGFAQDCSLTRVIVLIYGIQIKEAFS